MRRLSRSALLLVILVLVTCTRESQPPPAETERQPAVQAQSDTQPLPPEWVVEACSSGNKSKNKPIICVDDKTLLPEPASARVWDVEKERGTQEARTSRPVKIRWIAKDTIDLRIKFKDETCVTNAAVKCDGQGECTATLKSIDWEKVPKDAEGKQYLPCKYELSTPSADPDGELIVNPCCW
jgi:hypothetical protein